MRLLQLEPQLGKQQLWRRTPLRRHNRRQEQELNIDSIDVCRKIGHGCLAARHCQAVRFLIFSLGNIWCRAFTLVGDHYQLPPLVTSKAAEEGGLGVSLFKRLCEAHPQVRAIGTKIVSTPVKTIQK